MREYSQDEVIRLAKRVNNNKRKYLLVNPLQAKHVPVSPTVSLEMMHTLGEKLLKKYPETRLIVGFAETATAIGVAVAECFPRECIYMHTTREEVVQVHEWIRFEEEHSHAIEQKIAAEGFLKAANATNTILFVEDEISTGNTLRNMINQLKAIMPNGGKKKIVAASIINRMSEENEQLLLKSGITCECLVRIPEEDYTESMEQCEVSIAEQNEKKKNRQEVKLISTTAHCCNPRQAVKMSEYLSKLRQRFYCVNDQIKTMITKGMRLLMLGTEECMYPALMYGKMLEEQFDIQVFCHATTRSPIGISDEMNYPIKNGRSMKSLYQKERKTFLYNLAAYDAVIIVSDAERNVEQGLQELSDALNEYGNEKILYIQL